MLNPRFLTLTVITLTAASMRLVPHPPNCTPLAAVALFGGAHFASGAAAFAVPLAAMILSDLVMGAGMHASTAFVYGSFALTVCLGLAIRGRSSPLAVAGAGLAGSLTFFVLTNLGVWLEGELYPMTAAGLAACYVAAIPFFRNTLGGDALYVVVLFGGFALAERRFGVLRQGKAPVHAPA